MNPRSSLLAFVLSALAPLGGFGANYKVEKIGACTLPDVPEVFKSSLQAEGARVSGDSGAMFEAWFRKVIPIAAGADRSYASIAEGTFLGVVRFVTEGADCRGQVIHSGIYSMRYYTIPVDGNHMGVAPTSDFALLGPIALEKDPGATIPRETFIPLSAKIAGATHPVVLYLPPPSAGNAWAFHETGDSLWTLEGLTRAQPGGGPESDFAIALVLIGKLGT